MGGICYLVGAGPGDVGLLTLKAQKVIQRADVIAYDFLINPVILNLARADAQLVRVGKRKGKHLVPQEKISRMLVQWVKQKKCVVRLKGGDPFLFARGGEEIEVLAKSKCAFEIVPGVTAGIAAPAYAGIPLSHRDYNSTITFVTGHEASAKEKTAVNWSAIAQLGGTIVIYMGMERLKEIVQRLRQEGMSEKKPVAVIQWGTWGRQKTVTAFLCDIAQKVKKEKLDAPAIIVIGDVVNFRKPFHWLEKKSLFGKKIVITRPRAQASRLRELLEEKGADVWELPTIKILPYTPRQKIDFGKYDWLIFASPNGVEHFFQWFLKKNDVRSLGKIKIAALGPATASAVEKFGLKISLLPKTFTSAGLVQTWKKSSSSQRALYPCSNCARDEIKNGLRLKNVSVDHFLIYKTIPEKEDLCGIKEKILREGADWIIFTSSSAVENFHKGSWLHAHSFCERENLTPLRRTPHYASLGPVTSATLRRLGYSVHLQAGESRLECLVEELERWFLKKRLMRAV
ncbi:MAG: uroporphyrinogen-III C-methyltransferase [Verrucomicrobiota bacterium]